MHKQIDSHAPYRSRWIPAFAGMTMLLILNGCISGVKEPDSYTDHTGKTTLIETDRETCMRSCNEDYSRCMDTGPAQNQNTGLREDPVHMFGASADCRSDLKQCTDSCQTR